MKMIKTARQRAGFTQQELATRSGISQPALARIENRVVTPRFDTVVRILRECGMSVEAVPRSGGGVDRSTIRRMLAISAAERLALAATEADNLSKLRRR